MKILDWFSDNSSTVFQTIILLTLVVYVFVSKDADASDKIISAFIGALSISPNLGSWLTKKERG